MISLLTSGDIAAAESLLQQSQSDALSQHQIDLLPKVDTYTAYLKALLETQQKALHSNDSIAEIISLAEKAHDLLVQMEDLSGVSDEYSSMRMSGTTDGHIRQPTLRPTTLHYNSVITALSNVSITAHELNYNTHFTMNAPYIAQRWLGRMETISASSSSSGVMPTLESYHNVMKACSVVARMNKQSKSPILTQAIFDNLRQRTDISPTVKEYRLLMQTWSDSLCKDSAFRSTGVWMDMQRAFRKGDKSMEPTLEDGKMVLKSWSRAM